MLKFDRKVLCIFMLLLLVSGALSGYASPADYNRNAPESLTQDQLYGESAIVMDAANGNILFEKNAKMKMYPASTTKIMTLLLACESGWSLDMQVSVPAEAEKVPQDSSLIPVYAGDSLTFGDLLYGMMLHSGNDGANAIAMLVGGSIQNFVAMMNDRAAQLGCTGTHFANAHGYHDEYHYTTALDLAKMAQAAMKNETFRKISATYSKTITVNGAGGTRVIDLINKNVMLNSASDYYLNGCVGIKTGSHTAAGQCFVNAVDNDDLLLITVTLKCPEETQKWVDSIRMTKYGYTQYTSYTLEKMFEMITPRIATAKAANAKSDDPNGGVIQYKLSEISDPIFTRKIQTDNAQALTQALEDFASRIEIRLSGDLVAPITQGEAIGTFSYQKQNGESITATLIAGADIEAQPKLPALFDFLPFLRIFANPLVLGLTFVLLLLFVMIALALREKKRREQKRRMAALRRRKAQAARRRAAGEATPQRKAKPSTGSGTRGKAPASKSSASKTARSKASRPQQKKTKKEYDELFDSFDE